MKFLFCLMMVSCSFAALAQTTEEPSLFPELSGFTATQATTPLNDDAVEVANMEEGNTVAEAVITEEDLFKESEEPSTEKIPKATEEEPEEDEKDEKEKHIYIVIDDVKATLTPNRNASFCSATFAVANGLRKELKAFAGNFTIGSMTKEFKFTNISKEKASAAKYTFVGVSCEEILEPPAYTIKTCQVEGWSEKKCKEKVQLIPIPKQEDSLK